MEINVRYHIIMATIWTFFAIQPVQSDTKITSHFGFPLDLPAGWFVVSPDLTAKYNKNESLESLGIPNSIDKETMDEILDKAKGSQIEFYYDQRYVNSELKNNISLQLSEPVLFDSIQEAKNWASAECDSLPSQLIELYRESPELHSCQLVALNRVIVFRHSYTLKSQNITIINELVPLTADYSIVIVGGSANGDEGLARIRTTQGIILDALTSYVYAHREQ